MNFHYKLAIIQTVIRIPILIFVLKIARDARRWNKRWKNR